MSSPQITVIVPTYKDLDSLSQCITCLSQQDIDAKKFEIIIVNNDNQARLHTLHLPTNARIIAESTPGSYAARNSGIRRSSGEFLAFTDADCLPSKNWLSESISFLEKNSDIDFIGGKISLLFKSDRLSAIEIYEKAFAFPQDEITRGRKYSVTANMFVRKSAFEKAGLFNENLLSGGDREWGKRAAAAGLMIGYSENSIVFHPARRSLREFVKKRIRVSGGQYLSINSIWEKVAIIIVGILPPAKQIFALLKRNDLTTREKLVSAIVIYLARSIRSMIFLLLFLSLTNPKRS